MPDENVDVTSDDTTETENSTTADTSAAAETTTDGESTAEATVDEKAKLLEALRKERELRKAAEKDRDAERAKASEQGKTAEELAAIKAQREAEQAVLAKANERIVKAELRAAAAQKVSNLNALTRLVDIGQIEVDEDGTPSSDDIAHAIDQFLTDFPEFAADKTKFSGSADQGTKGKQAAKRQLTHEDIKSMTPEQIVKAQKEGLLKDVLKGK